MNNLNSILKSRDITLLTKVCLVKAMVFPVVMYGCKSWAIKKAEHQKIDGFECGIPGFDPWVGKIPWRKERLPTPGFWPGEFQGDHKESDMTERLN